MGVEHYLQLTLTTGLGPVLIRRAIDFAGSAEAATRLQARDLRQIEGIGMSKSAAIARSLADSPAETERQLSRARELGHRILCVEDAEYPELLKHIPDPPPILYIRGQLEPRDLQALAIVGSRRCSHYGREQAERFAALLAGAGMTVISGGARGIDSAAHHGALQHPHGRTVAVLGSGLDVPYPPENAPLFDEISKRGAILSEFPFGTSPNPENFPRRNRIVSGLSRGVFVIEADQRSGALITARQAIDDHSRPVFALPGRVDNQLSIGPHQLIREGAILVSTLEDIFAGLEPFPDAVAEPSLFPTQPTPAAVPPSAPAPAPLLNPHQTAILSALGADPLSVDQLIDRTGLASAQILPELTFLALRGLIHRSDGQSYVRRKSI